MLVYNINNDTTHPATHVRLKWASVLESFRNMSSGPLPKGVLQPNNQQLTSPQTREQSTQDASTLTAEAAALKPPYASAPLSGFPAAPLTAISRVLKIAQPVPEIISNAEASAMSAGRLQVSHKLRI